MPSDAALFIGIYAAVLALAETSCAGLLFIGRASTILFARPDGRLAPVFRPRRLSPGLICFSQSGGNGIAMHATRHAPTPGRLPPDPLLPPAMKRRGLQRAGTGLPFRGDIASLAIRAAPAILATVLLTSATFAIAQPARIRGDVRLRTNPCAMVIFVRSRSHSPGDHSAFHAVLIAFVCVVLVLLSSSSPTQLAGTDGLTRQIDNRVEQIEAPNHTAEPTLHLDIRFTEHLFDQLVEPDEPTDDDDDYVLVRSDVAAFTGQTNLYESSVSRALTPFRLLAFSTRGSPSVSA